jgi:hypothetical protein
LSDWESALRQSRRIEFPKGLIAILDKVTTKPRYILAKGGITSSDVVEQGQLKRHLYTGFLRCLPLFLNLPERSGSFSPRAMVRAK